MARDSIETKWCIYQKQWMVPFKSLISYVFAIDITFYGSSGHFEHRYYFKRIAYSTPVI